MADVVPHYIAYEEHGEEDTYGRVYQVEPVGPGLVKAVGEQPLYQVYQSLEQQGGRCCTYTYQEAQYEYELLLADVPLPPVQEALHPCRVIPMLFHSLITFTCPPVPNLMIPDALPAAFSVCR